MPSLRTVAYAAIVLIVAIQLVPIHRDNPPVKMSLSDAPTPVLATLNRACRDCHTHTTVWPWYSYVAPVSWLVAHDVHEGRRRMNLSDWGSYNAKTKRKKLAGISTMLQEDEMPPWYYRPMHSTSHLSKEEISTISEWADQTWIPDDPVSP